MLGLILQQIKILEDFKGTLKETKEILPGVTINDNIKDDIYKSLTTVVDIDQYGQPMNNIAKARAEDPIGFDVKLAYLFEVTKGFNDWSTVVSAGKKNAIKDFEAATRKLNLEGQSVPKRPGFSQTNSNSYLDAMKTMKF